MEKVEDRLIYSKIKLSHYPIPLNETKKFKPEKKSVEILNNLQFKTFSKIYETLDEKKDGNIMNGDTIIAKIPSKACEIVKSVIKEASANSSNKLSKKQFIDLAMKHNRALSYNDLVSIIKSTKSSRIEKKAEENKNSSVLINNVSHKLASKKRPQNKNWYSIISKEKKGFLKRMKEQAYKKQKDELNECSFKPSILLTTSFSKKEEFKFNDDE